MSTDLELRLREALHDDARRARLVNPERPPERDVLVLSDAPQRARSGAWLAVVAASVALIAAAGLVLVHNVRDGAPEAPTSPRSTQVFTDIAPDSTVPLPPGPIDTSNIPAAVWTGTEIIVWGDIDARNASAGVGAAFNLATGTWRIIAPAPIQGRAFAHVAWTGTEMIVWGGLYRDGTVTNGAYNQSELADGAAYDPTTDTWRLLPEAPIDYSASYSNAVWTGDEVIVLGGGEGVQAAAYDPSTNEWRRLADVPVLAPPQVAWAPSGPPIWTGTTILATYDPTNPVLARYDVRADTWHLDREARYAALVGVPDDDGVTSTVIGLPVDTGAPVDVLDDTGTPVTQLPGPPIDGAEFGDQVEAHGVWVGDEALFWFTNPAWGAGLGAPAGQGPEAWALNPATQTWRKLPEGAEVIDPELAIGDILFATASPGGDGAHAVLYRAPTRPTADPDSTHVESEPEAVGEPATAASHDAIGRLGRSRREGET